MSSADLFEDGFPHGTREGYERGCRGHGSCPGQLEFGRTCAQAHMNYAGDFTYKKRVDAGMTPAEIAELERADGVKPAKVPTRTTEISSATVTVADSVMPLGDLAEPVAVAKPKPAPKVSGLTPEKHGTMAGYSAGCRLKEACPGIERTGVSCTQAVSAYQRELKERKAAAKAAESPQDAPSVESVPEVAEPEIVSEVVAEPVPEPNPAESSTRVRAEGILTELADAKDEIERLRVQLEEARQRARGMESHGDLVGAELRQARIDLAEVTRQRDGQNQKLLALQAEYNDLADTAEQLRERLDNRGAEERAAVPMIPAETWAAAVAPNHGASLQVRQLGDAFAFDISGGGEAVRLELEFNGSQLQRAAVTTGA